MNREGARIDAALEVFLAWLASVVELFASYLALIARDG